MAASETVRLRLQFDYPPPVTPHCSSFWLLVDLSRCRVVTDLISLIRQRFGFSSGALLALYLDGGLLPPAESARLVRDNDCLRVKLEDREVTENRAVVSNGYSGHLLPKKARKRAFQWEEDEETEFYSKNPKKPCRRQGNSKNKEKNLAPEPNSSPDHSVRKKSKRKKKAAGQIVEEEEEEEEEEETQRKTPKAKEKCEYKKRTKTVKTSKAQKEWTLQNSSSSKYAQSQNSHHKAKTEGGPDSNSKDCPSSDTDSETLKQSAIEGRSKVASETTSTELSKEKPPLKNTIVSKVAAKPGAPSTPVQGKSSRDSSSDSDSTSDSEDESMSSKMSQKSVLRSASIEGRASAFLGQLAQTSSAATKKYANANGGTQVLGSLSAVTFSSTLGRGLGRGQDILPWKGARGRGMQGRGRGRSFSNVLNRNTEHEKQQQLNEVVANSSVVIQNPVETSKDENSLLPPLRDYNLLPLLAAAPQVGEKIAFKLLELAQDYSPGVSEYKEGKLLNYNPETQQVDIEILSSLPATKEPGKFDLVYHNENGAEVVEYAVMQEKKITVLWKELIDPRLIIESSNNTSSLKLA